MTPRELTAKEAAQLAGRSKSQIHRDVESGKLPVARQFPGHNGARLFLEDDVRKVYGVAS